jgi:hypothetical protein
MDDDTGTALLTCRLDQFEKRADAADARMGRIEALLTEIRVDLARKPTVAGLWGMVATLKWWSLSRRQAPSLPIRSKVWTGVHGEPCARAPYRRKSSRMFKP